MTRWLPNAFSLSRVLLAFLLLVRYRVDRPRLGEALVIFTIAAVTDKLDGALARRLGVASYRGYLVDGFADRTFSVACVLLGSAYYRLPLWVALLAITRELLLYTRRLLNPAAWHPPSRPARFHSLLVFGVTRLWFLGLLVATFCLASDNTLARCALTLLNGAYSIVITISSLLLFQGLLNELLRCLEDEHS